MSLSFRPALSALALFFLLAMTSFAAPTAHAETSPSLFEELTEEEKLLIIDGIDEGNTAYARGEFQMAKEAYEEVFALFPHPDILYRLALSHERLGNDLEAVEHYRLFLELSPDTEERGKVERTIDLIERRQRQTGSFLQILTVPEGAALRLDAEDGPLQGISPLQIELPPGRYTFFLEKEGFQPTREEVEVIRGQTVILRTSLTPLKAAKTAGNSETSKLPLWQPITAIGLASVGAFALYRSLGHHQEGLRQEDELRLWRRENIREGNEDELQRRLDLIDQERRNALGLGVFGGAALLGAASLTAFILLHDREESAPTMALTPLVGGASLGLQGRF